jgi:hypothetical protein
MILLYSCHEKKNEQRDLTFFCPMSTGSMRLSITCGTGGMLMGQIQIRMDLTTLMRGADRFLTFKDFHQPKVIKDSVKLPVWFMRWA